MSLEAIMLEYFTPFSYLFKDKDWFKKFAIASLLTYTLLGAAPIFGWTIEIVRRVGKGEEPAIPELKDWMLFWNLGGKFALVNAIWLLPLLFAVILLYLPLIFANSIKPELMLAVFGGTLCCVMLFLFVYTIVYVFFFPAMMVMLAEGGLAWKAMNPVHLWKMVRPRFTEYLMVFLIVGIALINVILLLSAFTLFLLLPPMLIYAGLVTAHYAGQLMRINVESITTEFMGNTEKS
jgi:hypothetical protein